MTLKDLIDLSGDRELSKSYPKADGVYIWDYKLVDMTNLELISSDSGKAGFKDKVSVDELVNYVLEEYSNGPITPDLNVIQVTGVEGITIAKI
jgi:hypothetical protein